MHCYSCFLWPLHRLVPVLALFLSLAVFCLPVLAQQDLEAELQRLQARQQQELQLLREKIESRKAVPVDPATLGAKVRALETKIASYEAPLEGGLATRPAMQRNTDYVWVITAGVMVFFMQAGFCLLEMGLVRAKNCVNVAMKCLLQFCSTSLCYLLVGFTLMFGPSARGWIGTQSFWLSDFSANSPLWSFWLFQVVFCGAACTIASGAMAERTKFLGYLIYAALFAALVYPIMGHWAWGSLSAGYEASFGGGKGWLEALGFHDFAGSTVVHGMGGAAALAGILVVGPRLGRFEADGTPRLIAGHSIPLAVLGTFILWMAWFGFNAGSTLAGGAAIGRIAVNTCIAASASGIMGLIFLWMLRGLPDAASTMNGILAGAVAITAGCDVVTPFSAILIGMVSGMLCTLATILMEKMRLDDAVGAVPVHLVCGFWGTLAAGLFHEAGFSFSRVGVQALGSLLIIVGAFATAFISFKVIDATFGLRASDEDQETGLDFSEHATNAYPDFKTTER